MNKKSWIIIAIVAILLIGGGIFFYVRNSSPAPNKSNYEAGKTSANDNLKQKTETDHQEDENQENQMDQKNEENQEDQENSPDVNTINETTQGITESNSNSAPPVEEQIATFSTKIYTKDSARQNNISITCNTLNGTIVKNGSSFSFCNTVGASSTSKGYQKADIFDKNGNKKKGLGGRKLSN